MLVCCSVIVMLMLVKLVLMMIVVSGVVELVEWEGLGDSMVGFFGLGGIVCGVGCKGSVEICCCFDDCFGMWFYCYVVYVVY